MFHEQLRQRISDAEDTEIGFTASCSEPRARQLSPRLIERRVGDENPDHNQRKAHGELLRVGRHHAVFADTPPPMLENAITGVT